MKVTLTVVEGPNQGQSFSFDSHDTLIVGRGRTAHLRLPPKDKFFSRNHFMIELNPPLCRLIDIASSNGTFVNDQRVSEIDLSDGDLIRGGDTVIRVSFQRGETAAIEATLAAPAPTPSEPPSVRADPQPEEPPQSTQLVAAPRASGGKSESATGRDQSIPSRIGDFDIDRIVGQGGMGVVYLARDRSGKGQVALKTISPADAGNRREIEKFLREVSILKQLDHPHIVRFHQFGSAGDCIYMAMQFVDGSDAQEILDRQGPLDIPRAVEWTCQLLDALQFAHNLRFVHRDIKPANLLVTDADGKESVKLADFGLARIYQASKLSGLTVQGQVGGSLGFLSPEQITSFRDVDPRSDLYATAASLYHLLTGQYIYDFPKPVAKRLLLVLQSEPIPITERRQDLPPGLAEVIHRALAREPKDRIASAEEMRQALLPYCKN